MLRVEIDIPYPRETLLLLLTALGVAAWMNWGGSPSSIAVRAQAVPERRTEQVVSVQRGGPDSATRAFAVRDAESQAQRIRAEQAVLERREEILRYELQILTTETERFGRHTSLRIQQDLQDAEEHLKNLLSDTFAAEDRLRSTLQQMWEAEGMYPHLASGSAGDTVFDWPVEPQRGLSATFLDKAYEKRFGIPHHAIDIPVEQGSDVRAAGDGTVERVIDNGLGYNYIIIRHEGTATLYGHVSEFYVEEGQEVHQGDVIAASGGLPGTKGAGALTTGPHLHFEVIMDGSPTDPLTVLPARPEVTLPSDQ